MVRMRSTPSPSIAVTMELDGGIRNLACQDDVDESCCPPANRQNCQSIGVPINKSTELLTVVQSTERLDLGPVVANTVDPMATSAGSQTASQKIMNACRTFWSWRFLANVVITLLMGTLLGAVELGLIPHRKLGFWCNDPIISFPYDGETISTGVLIGVTVFLPLLVIWPLEWFCHKSDSYRNLRPGCTGTRGGLIWTWYGQYISVVVSLLCLCELIKIIIGSPRPHFLDTCLPLEGMNCTDSGYVSSFTCTRTNESFWFVMDASKSFPSGHATLSTFTSIFLVYYIQIRVSRRATSFLLKPWLQWAIMSWAVACSFSRISDHRHHWWDVLVGIIMGFLTAIYCIKINVKEFVLKDVEGTTWTNGEPVENGNNHGYDSRRHQSVRKLLSNTSVENREMGDVVSTWKE